MIKHPLLITLIDFALFQAIWWGAALWGNAALVWLILLLGVHLVLLHQAPKRDVLALCLIAPVGWSIDLSLQALGFWDLHSQLPLWLLVIWAGFVLSLFYSLAWLQKFKPIGHALEELKKVWLMNSPMTLSWMSTDLEKQIVFRAKRLIRVRKFKFCRSIDWV